MPVVTNIVKSMNGASTFPPLGTSKRTSPPAPMLQRFASNLRVMNRIPARAGVLPVFMIPATTPSPAWPGVKQLTTFPPFYRTAGKQQSGGSTAMPTPRKFPPLPGSRVSR